ncbi:ABC transporter substrate-binding protein [Actinokineospora sp. HUAS TT18]|uniref:ABC transporter substrate-binding protein n=1 Tax=Actinokineospora sp. HUAS TT18 TaxID=3447451 RepID=UPI003F51B9C5
MPKRIPTALLAASLAITAAGCGTQAGADDPVVTVGAILSMSGVYATLGPAEKNAMTMGVEALNKVGFTVDGKRRTLEITYADDKSDPATSGVTALREMTQAQHLPVIAYGLGSATYVPQLQRKPVPMINILDSSFPSILDKDPHLYLTRGGSHTYVPGCLAYAKQKLGLTSIAVITAKGEPYGEGLTELVRKSAPAEGLTVVAASEYPLGATDYSNAISAAVAAKPDAIYLSSVTGVILPVLKQLRQSGWSGPVFHSSGVNPNQAEAILGEKFSTFMVDNFDCAGTLPTTSKNPAAAAFARAYEQRWNEYPQDLTMWAYDFPFIVAAAMAKAGSTTDPEKIHRALPEIGVPEGTVSGWIPSAKNTLFDNRGARTASEVTIFCSQRHTLASAMTFDVAEGKVVDAVFNADACK